MSHSFLVRKREPEEILNSLFEQRKQWFLHALSTAIESATTDKFIRQMFQLENSMIYVPDRLCEIVRQSIADDRELYINQLLYFLSQNGNFFEIEEIERLGSQLLNLSSQQIAKEIEQREKIKRLSQKPSLKDKKQIELLLRKLTVLNTVILSLAQEIRTFKRRYPLFLEKIKTEVVKYIKKRLSSSNQVLYDLRFENRRLQQKNERFEALNAAENLVKQQQEILKLRNEVSASSSKIEKLKIKKKRSQRMADNYFKQLTSIKSELEKTKSESFSIQSEYTKIKQKNDTNESLLMSSRNKADNAMKEKNEYEERYRQSLIKIEKLKKILQKSETKIENLTKENKERIQKLCDDKDQLIQNLTIEKDKQIQELTELKDKKILDLQNDKENQIKELIDQKEKQLNELKMEKENQIKELKTEKEDQIKELINQKEKQLNELKNEKEKQILELTNEKLMQMQELTQKKDKTIFDLTNEKEKQISDLKNEKDNKIKEITEIKEKQIKELTESKDKQIKELTEMKEKQILELRNEKEKQILDLKTEKEKQITDIINEKERIIQSLTKEKENLTKENENLTKEKEDLTNSLIQENEKMKAQFDNENLKLKEKYLLENKKLREKFSEETQKLKEKYSVESQNISFSLSKENNDIIKKLTKEHDILIRKMEQENNAKIQHLKNDFNEKVAAIKDEYEYKTVKKYQNLIVSQKLLKKLKDDFEKVSFVMNEIDKIENPTPEIAKIQQKIRTFNIESDMLEELKETCFKHMLTQDDVAKFDDADEILSQCTNLYLTSDVKNVMSQLEQKISVSNQNETVTRLFRQLHKKTKENQRLQVINQKLQSQNDDLLQQLGDIKMNLRTNSSSLSPSRLFSSPINQSRSDIDDHLFEETQSPIKRSFKQNYSQLSDSPLSNEENDSAFDDDEIENQAKQSQFSKQSKRSQKVSFEKNIEEDEYGDDDEEADEIKVIQSRRSHNNSRNNIRNDSTKNTPNNSFVANNMNLSFGENKQTKAKYYSPAKNNQEISGIKFSNLSLSNTPKSVLYDRKITNEKKMFGPNYRRRDSADEDFTMIQTLSALFDLNNPDEIPIRFSELKEQSEEYEHFKASLCSSLNIQDSQEIVVQIQKLKFENQKMKTREQKIIAAFNNNLHGIAGFDRANNQQILPSQIPVEISKLIRKQLSIQQKLNEQNIESLDELYNEYLTVKKMNRAYVEREEMIRNCFPKYEFEKVPEFVILLIKENKKYGMIEKEISKIDSSISIYQVPKYLKQIKANVANLIEKFSKLVVPKIDDEEAFVVKVAKISELKSLLPPEEAIDIKGFIRKIFISM
ncbi:hypothetical protein TRFO_03739 [Tritrichomonas foetus]|uniref:Uncharacterized protein n=1 Tax=Tritrichomonas foetus TaxID=1144522 RepID=A0A1J4KR13_9EUKA|nr:hypothetical protein TRFO_03739 [Tritrichomonas foetus]|eukprot:OHT12110.1 hypothetical protein TRFO_03739 [Tritrichomonas foetus]